MQGTRDICKAQGERRKAGSGQGSCDAYLNKCTVNTFTPNDAGQREDGRKHGGILADLQVQGGGDNASSIEKGDARLHT